MSNKFHCDKCDTTTKNNKPFSVLTLRANQTQQSGEMELCDICTDSIIRVTKKYSYDESKIFPNNFGNPDAASSLLSPPVAVDGVAVSILRQVFSAPPSAETEKPAPESGGTLSPNSSEEGK